jgi:tRNA-dihydrouridine synthase
LERLDFMQRHFHLRLEEVGERFACLTFRKVANWYCRVLKPGRDIQQQLMMLDSAVTFDRIVEGLRERAVTRNLPTPTPDDLPFKVPGGAVERW